MKFTFLPILDELILFYQQDRKRERFYDYLNRIIDEQGELKRPLPLLNPMAKDHILDCLEDLKTLKVEEHLQDCIHQINQEIDSFAFPDFKICFILADDWKGGWTNRYSTDYSNTFQSKGLLKRRFCTPIFWTSETYSAQLIKTRSLACMWRTLFQLQHQWPQTLEEHIRQEAFVQQKLGSEAPKLEEEELFCIYSIYEELKKKTDRSILIPFLYGDQAAKELGYSEIGAFDFMGFQLAASLVEEKPQ